MMILGLGSNLGDRMANLREALRLIKNIPGISHVHASSLYVSDPQLPERAPADWHKPFLNLAIRCEGTLSPQELLAQIKKIEIVLGRYPSQERWEPRAIDIDILAIDNITINTPELTLPHPRLFERPFALWPLADLAPFWSYQGKTAAEWVERWGSRFEGSTPFQTRQIFQRIDTPELVGIINVTPNSFSDGPDNGRFLTAHKAMQQAMHLVQAGATVIDIGAESTAPNAGTIDAKTEWERLEPPLQAIHAIKNNLFIPPKISIDTRHAEVAAKALNYHVDWINDVAGLDDPKMRRVIAPSQADCIVMHHMSIPEDRRNVLPRDQNPTDLVYRFAEQRLQELEKDGISRDRIIFDPGIGFGKMAEQSLQVLQHVAIFKQLGVRILVGHSRKSYLSVFTNMPFNERDVETTAVSLYLATKPVDYLRLHNVAFCARAFKVNAALTV